VNDPHVEALTYDLVPIDERYDFSSAVPWNGRLGSWECRLEAARLEAVPSEYYADEAAARHGLESYLRAWELSAELEHGVRFRFRFSVARVIDRQAIPGVVDLAATVVGESGMTGPLTIVHRLAAYPPPSAKQLASSALVEELLGWVRELREGRGRKLAIAYLVLTRLEYEFGNRKSAASTLRVSMPILKRLGELSAKNDPAERRKVKGPIASLSDAERRWIDAVVPKLVLQTAAMGSQPSMLTMADLPPL
jgi:hypothetical protein